MDGRGFFHHIPLTRTRGSEREGLCPTEIGHAKEIEEGDLFLTLACTCTCKGEKEDKRGIREW